MTLEWKRLGKLVATARRPANAEYEVVIIGAGLGGLRAAYELRAQDVLVLERESRAGGRVLTRERDGMAYDLGAVFGFDARALPFALSNTQTISEPTQIGIVGKTGHPYIGTDVFDCLRALDFSSDEWSAFARFCADAAFDAGNLPSRMYAALNAFFQVIHPGDLRAYTLARQRDALVSFSTTHYATGNRALVDALITRGDLQSRVRLGAEVTSITDQGARVRIEYHQTGNTYEVFARAAIVTTPAPITRKIVATIQPNAERYLAGLQYAPGIVVALGVRGDLPGFAYLVTPDAPMSTILQQHTPQNNVSVFLVYYAGDKATRVQTLTDEALIEQTGATLRDLGLASDIIFADVHRWQHIGPIISPQACAAWSSDCIQLSPRIILGGEAACFDPQNPMPYGMTAALVAGQGAATLSRPLFAKTVEPRPCLVDATLYRLTHDQPIFVERVSEGNVTYYGLVLQATRDSALKNYLLACARESLWEYQLGFGVTAEDSALVIEGLLECGMDRAALEPSLHQLVAQFYDPGAGAFHTVRGGRGAYWRGPSVDASAQIGYLMRRIAPDVFAEQIRACAAFVARHRQPDGLWQSRWFPSRLVTTYYATRLLNDSSVQSAISNRQMHNGSWNNSVIDTAAAMLALRTLDPRAPALGRARTWLLSQRESDKWRGEPILYYWFEENDEKLFYHCADKGEITSAWATLALDATRQT